MTADPKAPGAVYLNISEDVNDPLHYESYYADVETGICAEFYFRGKQVRTLCRLGEVERAVDKHYGERVSDQTTYHLPAGITVFPGRAAQPM